MFITLQCSHFLLQYLMDVFTFVYKLNNFFPSKFYLTIPFSFPDMVCQEQSKFFSISKYFDTQAHISRNDLIALKVIMIFGNSTTGIRISPKLNSVLVQFCFYVYFLVLFNVSPFFQAHYFSLFPKIIGVEMNVEFCHIQNEIVNKYGLGNRIQVKMYFCYT